MIHKNIFMPIAVNVSQTYGMRMRRYVHLKLRG